MPDHPAEIAQARRSGPRQRTTDQGGNGIGLPVAGRVRARACATAQRQRLIRTRQRTDATKLRPHRGDGGALPGGGIASRKSKAPSIFGLISERKPRGYSSVVESRTGAVALPRFPSPLIERSVRISRTTLSDWLHPAAVGGAPMCIRRSRSTPSFPKTTGSENRRVPREGTLCRRVRKPRTAS